MLRLGKMDGLFNFDRDIFSNSDWDLSYLSMIFKDNFEDMSDLWNHGNSCSDEILS